MNNINGNNQNNNSEVNFGDSVRPTINESMLVMLNVQKDNFPLLSGLLKTKFGNPGSIFLPQNLQMLDDEVNVKEDVVIECMAYLDVVKNYSIGIYGDSETYINQIVQSIVTSRTVFDLNKVLGKNVVQDYLYSDKKSFYEFLNNNKILIAIYIFSLVNFITFAQS